MYLAFFSVGMSSTVWTVNSEIYPIHLVGTAVALATATNWIANFVVSSVFLTSMETDSGKVTTFVVLAFFALLAEIFVYLYVPETAGKTVEENVDKILGRDNDDSYFTYDDEQTETSFEKV